MKLFHRPVPPAPPEPGDVLAEAVDADVVRGSRHVLRRMSLSVAAGELVAVVGPNGAGKSTTVGLLSGDFAPRSGTVSVYGKPVGEWRHVELAMRRAVLPQHTGVAFPFTVAQIVAMGRSPWARTPVALDDEAVVAEALAATEVADFADRTFGTLSGGERARVALARVLAQRAPLLLLDEPTAALDLRHQDLVLRVAVAHARAGGAVLAVLHDLNLASAHADRVAVVAEGRLVACGPPADVLVPDLLSDVYRRAIEVIPHPGTGIPLILP